MKKGLTLIALHTIPVNLTICCLTSLFIIVRVFNEKHNHHVHNLCSLFLVILSCKLLIFSIIFINISLVTLYVSDSPIYVGSLLILTVLGVKNDNILNIY